MRSQTLWSRPISTTGVRAADKDDNKSTYDKIKDKAGMSMTTSYSTRNEPLQSSERRDPSMPGLSAVVTLIRCQRVGWSPYAGQSKPVACKMSY